VIKPEVSPFFYLLLLEIIMKISLITSTAMASGFASLAFFSVAPVMAEGFIDYPGPVAQSAQSTRTRAQVRAELQQAIKDGTLQSNQPDGGGLNGDTVRSAAAPASPLTREVVRADTIEWLRLNRADLEMGSR
jgi:Domain of unknown function (DUF4148)